MDRITTLIASLLVGVLTLGSGGGGEEIDSRLFGQWRSTGYVKSHQRKARQYCHIYRDEDRVLMVKRTEFVDSEEPPMATLIGEQTYQLEPLSPGRLKVTNVDSNPMSKTVCSVVDCETKLEFRFSDAETLIFERPDGQEVEFAREEEEDAPSTGDGD